MKMFEFYEWYRILSLNFKSDYEMKKVRIFEWMGMKGLKVYVWWGWKGDNFMSDKGWKFLNFMIDIGFKIRILWAIEKLKS
jgi:hypothetical protein